MSASTAKTSIASTRAGFFLYDAEWTKRSSAGGAGQINRESLGPHRDGDEARRATPRTILDSLSAADDDVQQRYGADIRCGKLTAEPPPRKI